MLTPKQKAGIALEKPVANFLEQRMHLGSKVDHNDFSESGYPLDNHNIVDIKVTDKALIECSNDKETTFMGDDVMNKKLDYFPRADSKHLLLWILIMPFFNFSKAILQRITNMGVIPIELGITAIRTNFHTIINHLYHSKLYSIAVKFRAKKSPQSSIANQSITTLTQYTTVPISQSGTKENNYLHLHTEPSDEQILAYLRTVVKPRWIQERLREIEKNGGEL